MVDHLFAEFVQKHLLELDELSRQYAKYRFEVCQRYWDELRKLVRETTPNGYEFLEDNRELSVAREHVSGWSRPVEIGGTLTAATIAFGCDTTVQDTSGSWPLNACWTGIKLSLPGDLSDELLKIARLITPNTRNPDRKWLLWREWEPLNAADIEGLYERITGSQRRGEQQEIVDQLCQWNSDFERCLAQLQAQA